MGEMLLIDVIFAIFVNNGYLFAKNGSEIVILSQEISIFFLKKKGW